LFLINQIYQKICQRIMQASLLTKQKCFKQKVLLIKHTDYHALLTKILYVNNVIMWYQVIFKKDHSLYEGQVARRGRASVIYR